MRSSPRNTDQNGRPIQAGDTVRVARCLMDRFAHPDFKKSFRLVAGSTRPVSHSSASDGVSIRIGRWEVLTIEARRLKIVRKHASRQSLRYPVL